MSVPRSNLAVRSKRIRTEAGGVECEDEAKPTPKQIFKIQRGFAIRLVVDAVESGWEMHELGSLIHSIIQQLPLNTRKLHKFLLKCEVCHPQILGKLIELGVVISPGEAIGLISHISPDIQTFLQMIDDAFEQQLFHPKDEDAVATLMQYFSGYEGADDRDLALKICEHSGSKRACARVLKAFTQDMDPVDAASFIHDVISLDYFHDLSGNLESLLSEMPDIRTELEHILHGQGRLGANGDLVDSDEDENGDLKGFIVNDLGGGKTGGYDPQDDDDEDDDDYQVGASLGDQHDEDDDDDDDEDDLDNHDGTLGQFRSTRADDEDYDED